MELCLTCQRRQGLNQECFNLKLIFWGVGGWRRAGGKVGSDWEMEQEHNVFQADGILT